MILIYMMVLCTQVNKMYVIATLSVYPLYVAITYILFTQARIQAVAKVARATVRFFPPWNILH